MWDHLVVEEEEVAVAAVVAVVAEVSQTSQEQVSLSQLDKMLRLWETCLRYSMEKERKLVLRWLWLIFG
jgi:heat shock protein HspQ